MPTLQRPRVLLAWLVFALCVASPGHVAKLSAQGGAAAALRKTGKPSSRGSEGKAKLDEPKRDKAAHAVRATSRRSNARTGTAQLAGGTPRRSKAAAAAAKKTPAPAREPRPQGRDGVEGRSVQPHRAQ